MPRHDAAELLLHSRHAGSWQPQRRAVLAGEEGGSVGTLTGPATASAATPGREASRAATAPLGRASQLAKDSTAARGGAAKGGWRGCSENKKSNDRTLIGRW